MSLHMDSHKLNFSSIINFPVGLAKMLPHIRPRTVPECFLLHCHDDADCVSKQVGPELSR